MKYNLFQLLFLKGAGICFDIISERKIKFMAVCAFDIDQLLKKIYRQLHLQWPGLSYCGISLHLSIVHKLSEGFYKMFSMI